MKKPKRRYTHPGQIEADIDRAKTKATDLMKSAEEQERLSVDYAMKANTSNVSSDRAYYLELVDRHHKKAIQLRTTATNLMEGKLKYYAQKLAELNTKPLPGFLPDDSVEA